jgi:ribosomal protein L7/L12
MNNFYLAGSQNLVGRLEEIASLLRAGKKINAIKAYREITGASLAEAKDAVERLDMALRMYGTMVVADALMEVAQQGMPMDMDVQSILLTEMAFLVSKGQYIQAIKLYRERTGMGLSDAKMVVDRIKLMMRASGF